MKSTLFRSKGFIILATIEIITFFRIKPSNLEMFFLVWCFTFLILLLYNVFNVSVNMRAGGGYVNFSNSIDENEDSKKRSLGGLYDPINIAYLLMLIINIVGYIIVMPK